MFKDINYDFYQNINVTVTNAEISKPGMN